MKPVEKLLYEQGGNCFFCGEHLPKSEASVEHLCATANGGTDAHDNRVACCKTLNELLGSKSVKQKFEIVLNQGGSFKCPKKLHTSAPAKPPAAPKTPRPQTPSSHAAATPVLAERFETVVKNLTQRVSNTRPKTLKRLKSLINSLFQNSLSEQEIDEIIELMQSGKRISVNDGKITYL